MIQSVDKLLKVVGITGQVVQFLGYIEVDLKFPESESGTSTSQKAFVLVVPDTEYNKRVPLVVGTNVTRCVKEEYCRKSEEMFLQHCSLSSSWKRASKAVLLHEQFSRRCKHGKNNVKCTSHRPVTIEAYQTVVVWGTAKSLPNVTVKAIIEPQAILPGVTTTQS